MVQDFIQDKKYEKHSFSVDDKNRNFEERYEDFELRSFSSMRMPKPSIIKGGTRPRTARRTDRNGTLITSKAKSQRVSFADSVTNDRDKLTDVYLVESYKRFNAENTHGAA